jgi:hypothetical protein
MQTAALRLDRSSNQLVAGWGGCQKLCNSFSYLVDCAWMALGTTSESGFPALSTAAA